MDSKPERLSMVTRRKFAQIICRQAGMPLVELGVPDALCVLSTGAGLLMSFVDHVQREYPGLAITCCDLPGHLTLLQRARCIDYCTQAYPTVLLQWASLQPATALIEQLEARDFRAPKLWYYCKGLDYAAAQQRVIRLGADPLDNLWQAHPIGNWQASRIECPSEWLHVEACSM